jgi:hypothetical protein
MPRLRGANEQNVAGWQIHSSCHFYWLQHQLSYDSFAVETIIE